MKGRKIECSPVSLISSQQSSEAMDYYPLFYEYRNRMRNINLPGFTLFFKIHDCLQNISYYSNHHVIEDKVKIKEPDEKIEK